MAKGALRLNSSFTWRYSGPGRQFRGRSAWSCPINASRPSAKVTMFPDALLDPSLARCPEMVSTSPSFRLDFVMPRLREHSREARRKNPNW